MKYFLKTFFFHDEKKSEEKTQDFFEIFSENLKKSKKKRIFKIFKKNENPKFSKKISKSKIFKTKDFREQIKKNLDFFQCFFVMIFCC